MKENLSKDAQIWVETVIYTLIGLSIIGLMLFALKPTIDSTKDKITIEQTIDSLNVIDSKIHDVETAVGNKRKLTLKISKGKLAVDSENDLIIWTLDSKHKYSEPNVEIELGNINIITNGSEDEPPWTITLNLNYSNRLNLTYLEQEKLKEFNSAPSPYELYISNKGTTNNKLNIDIENN